MAIVPTLVGKTPAKKSQMKAAAIRDVVAAAVTAAAAKNKTYTFPLLDGRVVKVEAVRFGVLKTDPVTHAIFFEQRTDGGADAIWVKVSVNGAYLNGDGWYGFVNPPILAPDRTLGGFKEDLVLAAKTMVAQAVGGEV